MSELPIYQMILQPLENGSFGLIFSEETDDFVQSVFVIPLKYNGNYWWDNQFYMPGEINGQYTEFILKPEGDIFYLTEKNLKHSVRFQIAQFNNYREPYLINDGIIRSLDRLEYVGKEKEFIQPFSEFVIISPIDLLIMDSLFYEQKACFVGLTPIFGERRNYQG